MASMSRKHFNALAETVRDARNLSDSDDANDVRDFIGRNIARICAESNPNFDVHRFLAACDLPY